MCIYLNIRMLVIGNGESRAGIDVSALNGPLVGCNGAMRDFNLDYLVCIDTKMVDEAVRRKITYPTLIYTRQQSILRYPNVSNLRAVPDLPYQDINRWDDPHHWGSGPYAVLIAANYSHEREVKLLGFDLYSKNQLINNVYKDTNGYKESTSAAIDSRYWIHQIGMVFQCFPKTKFIVYQEDGWELPKAWKERNVSLDRISNIS